jgi:4-aminobutyrate aminotransferase-like enzyme
VREEDLLLIPCGPYKNVIRFAPPLIVSEDEVAEALRVTRLALEKSG